MRTHESPCRCPSTFWGSPVCEERSGPPDTYCRWERLCEERAAEEAQSDEKDVAP